MVKVTLETMTITGDTLGRTSVQYRGHFGQDTSPSQGMHSVTNNERFPVVVYLAAYFWPGGRRPGTGVDVQTRHLLSWRQEANSQAWKREAIVLPTEPTSHQIATL